MINLRIEPRTSRLVRLWLFNFVRILAVLMVALTIGGTIGYLIVLAISTYGFKIVLGGIFILWLLLMAGTIAGMLSEGQLNEMEREEERVMRKLRDSQ